ncbi:response regulator [Spelaeicoccus albus]|uniref:DNA-binding NarL/FixJ family response regulator n=1 Tax=Spelaeicoccus albus TaxID=1280376 RepID=A0A7Z0D411_9MICO|nr:response regulator transcription factor [Spelaeicoccus albus]NYI68477.1 DNA-binding NarL/FixJ family response regulator [Spelaeicoccus albus]
MRIAIAEDSTILRDGLVELLSARGHIVTAAVGDGTAFLAAVATDEPDVAIVDIRMPPTHTDEGLRAALALRERRPDIGVLVFSQYVETQYAAELFSGKSAGAGYLLKDRVADVSSFIDALERINAGQTVLDPEVVSQLMGSARGDGPLQSLTPRESEVLVLMAEGRSNAGIAESLFLSYGAVEKNVTAIFTKLGLAQSPADHRRVLAVLRYLESAR